MHVEASGPECRAEQSRAQNNYGGRWGMGKGLARAQKPAEIRTGVSTVRVGVRAVRHCPFLAFRFGNLSI